MDTNEELRMSRHGGADPDGNQPGDLYVVIKVKIKLHADWYMLCTQMCILHRLISASIHTQNIFGDEYLILVYM